MTGEKRPTENLSAQAAKKQRMEETEPVPTTPDHFPDAKCFGDTVEVTVGSGITEETHVIHKGLLCFYSEYFRGSLNGGFREAKEKKIALDDVDPEIFALFKGWLCTRKLCSGNEVKNDFQDEIPNFCELFVFGDRHFIPLLKNDVINAMMVPIRHKKYLGEEFCREIEYAYRRTPTGSPLRQFLMDAYAAYCCSGDVEPDENLQRAHSDASWDFALVAVDIAMGTSWEQKLPSLDSACEYHDHPMGIVCPET